MTYTYDRVFNPGIWTKDIMKREAILYFDSTWYDLGKKYRAPHCQSDWGWNSWPPDHNSTCHVTEMPALTPQPSVTSNALALRFTDALAKWFKHNLRQKFQAPQVRPNWGSNSWPLDHDSTFHVTEMPALATWPSVTSTAINYISINYNLPTANSRNGLSHSRFFQEMKSGWNWLYSAKIINWIYAFKGTISLKNWLMAVKNKCVIWLEFIAINVGEKGVGCNTFKILC